MAQDWKDMLAMLAGNDKERTDEVPSSPEEIESVSSSPDKTVQKSILRILIDRKGRKGKVATIIEGFEIEDDEVAEIAAELKKKIGTGGSSRGGEILLQGEWVNRAAELLRKKGYNVKT